MNDTNLKKIRSLSSGDLQLRPVDTRDLEQLHSWRNSFALSYDTISSPLPTSKEQTITWIQRVNEDSQQLALAICPVNSKEAIGIVRLMYIDWINSHAELGVYIGTEEWRGKGIGHRSLDLIFHYAFGRLNLHRIHLKVRSENTATIDLYKRIGFVEEGCLREHVSEAGRYVDVVQMGLLRDEFLPQGQACKEDIEE